MPHHIKGQSRTQATLLPEVLDDFVSPDNPVRVIDVFVDGLDLSNLGFQRVSAKMTGRPGYHPATMLKLYIYGYVNRIQSSRRLEKESNRNVELMWLLERLSPDFKTIADFRKDNGTAIQNSCKMFVTLCREMNMFRDVTVAIDGSKFKAVNNKDKNYNAVRVKKRMDRVESHIAKYLKQLDEVDAESSGSTDKVQIQSRIQWLKERLAELNKLKADVEAHPAKQVSLTDPDARSLRTDHFNRRVGYNAQTVVDTTHHLIIANKVTNTYDRGQVASMTELAQEALQETRITVLADKGYFGRNDIKAATELGAEVLIPKIDTSGSEKKKIFNKSLFKYNKERDIYICPAEKELPFKRIEIDKGVEQKVYYDYFSCKHCEIRANCTAAKSKNAPRKMRRWVHEELIDDMQGTLDKRPEISLLRKQTVEHPFGTIKMWMGSTHFAMKRMKHVSTEMSLHVLAYNLKRMIAIKGVQPLLDELKQT